jgi:prophage regulatory protein
LGLSEPDVELAKAELAIRIHRLAERGRLTPHEASALLKVPESELLALFQGRLATCSIDQLLRMLTWLGDDVEILIRPRLQRTKRGALRVLQAAAVEKPDNFEPVRTRVKPSRRTAVPNAAPDDDSMSGASKAGVPADDRRLLDKHAVEKMTSLDITTIYRKMSAGTFPQPVRVGRRRVAWRTSDILQWQQELQVGTDPADWMTGSSSKGRSRSRDGGSRK